MMDSSGNPKSFEMDSFFNRTNLPPTSDYQNQSVLPPTAAHSSSASHSPSSGPFSHSPHILYSQDQHRSPSFPSPPQTASFQSMLPLSPANVGARLMALLNQESLLPLTSCSSSVSSLGLSEFTVPANVPAMPATGTSMATTGPVRMSSSKLPKGRYLVGHRIVYDVDVRFIGEMQPHLEVTPITKYNSDPKLVLGRQIAVNKTYICYGLKQGNVRVLNVNTALRSLLRGHTQRVTDLVFFSEDVPLLASVGIDGRVYVWNISESPDEEDKPQITGGVVIAIQLVAEEEAVNPRICWHCHKQEVLIVGMGKRILRIETTKVGTGPSYVTEEPLRCPVDKPINGVQIVGTHDREVTDLSMCQWMTNRLVSASLDGTIKIWEDQKAQPLAVLRPHDGHPVYSAIFLTAPYRPDHIVLITAGPLNHELKLWASASKEGWLLPSDAEAWKCIQMLDFKCSTEPRLEDAFFNQVAALSQAGLLLLANSKRNSIYAVHLEYGPNPNTTRMDYLAEFTVAMPILSVTGRTDILPDGEHIVQIYCVQTQAIQSYALDLAQCMPPPLRFMSNSSIFGDAITAERITSSSNSALSSGITEASTSKEISSSNEEDKFVTVAAASSDADLVYSVDRQKDTIRRNLSDVRPLDNDSKNDGKKVTQDDISSIPNPSVMLKQPTHLVTPSEIIKAGSSSETKVTDSKNGGEANIQNVVVNSDVSNAEVEVKVVGEARFNQSDEFDLQEQQKNLISDSKEEFFCSQASDLGVDSGIGDSLAQHPNSGEDVPQHISDSSTSTAAPYSPHTNGKRQKGKGPSSSSPTAYNSTDSNNELSRSSGLPSAETAFPRILPVPRTLHELFRVQRELQVQTVMMAEVSVTKEGRRLEAALGRSMEKAVKAHTEGLWTQIQEENVKNEKFLGECVQQTTSSVSNFMKEDLPTLLEKTVKKEMGTVGPAIVRAISPAIEKTISSAIVEAFQRGVGDKAVNKLEKSVNSKIEVTVARQIQAQFQMTGKQVLQEALKSSFETSVVPAFEMSCKAMFEQVDATFQKGMAEHTTSVQQNLESGHTSLEMALKDAINSASSFTQTLGRELVEGQRNLLALAAAGANSGTSNPLSIQLHTGPLLHEKVEVPLDPKIELARLISEHKYEEAFNGALQISDVSIVSWLCSQVDLHGIFSMVPLPLSQGVVLSLLQQLACDINNNRPRKLDWMTDVAAAVNPKDPVIAMHAPSIFEQVYQLLDHQRTSPTMTGNELSIIRLLLHVINSMIMTCK